MPAAGKIIKIERPDWDLNPGLELRRLQGYPLPYRGTHENARSLHATPDIVYLPAHKLIASPRAITVKDFSGPQIDVNLPVFQQLVR